MLVLRFLSAGLALLVSLFIARRFGAHVIGVYYLALALVTVSATLSQLGLDLPLLRKTAVAWARGDWAEVLGLRRTAFRLSAVTAAVLATVLAATSAPLAVAFDDPSLANTIRLMCLAVLPNVILLLQARSYVGIGRPYAAELFGRIGFHTTFLLLLLTLATRPPTTAVGVAFSISYVIVLASALLYWSRVAPRAVARFVATADLLRPALPILASAALQLIAYWSDTVLLGLFLDSDSVGVYGASLRVSALMTLILAAAAPVFTPRFAALHQSKSHNDLARLSRSVSVWCALLGFPLLVVLFVGAGSLMALFGDEFTVGASSLRILAVGQFINVASGLVVMLLAMTGRETRVMHATLLSAVIGLLFNLALIPPYGIVGAAVGTSLALVAVNGAGLYFLYRDLGLDLLRGRVVRDHITGYR